MSGNIYIYIAIVAITSYLIRVLPLTLIRKPIKNRFIPVLCTLCHTCGYDLSCNH